MSTPLEDFYMRQEEPINSCFWAVREFLLSLDSNINEAYKWNIPCFLYKKKVFCYLTTEKRSNTPYIGFMEGRLLDYPELETGGRTRIKILRIDPNEDLDINILSSIVHDVIELYKNGTVKIR